MAWNALTTWADGTVPTSTDFNEQIRDNFTVLGAARGVTGLFDSLTTAAFATNPSTTDFPSTFAATLTDNSYTATNTFSSGGRLVIPTAASTVTGSVWVSGTAIAWRSATGAKSVDGYSLGACAGTVGSIWIEDHTYASSSAATIYEKDTWGGNLHYVDTAGNERFHAQGQTSVSTSATPGSIWVETSYLCWVAYRHSAHTTWTTGIGLYEFTLAGT